MISMPYFHSCLGDKPQPSGNRKTHPAVRSTSVAPLPLATGHARGGVSSHREQLAMFKHRPSASSMTWIKRGSGSAAENALRSSSGAAAEQQRRRTYPKDFPTTTFPARQTRLSDTAGRRAGLSSGSLPSGRRAARPATLRPPPPATRTQRGRAAWCGRVRTTSTSA